MTGSSGYSHLNESSVRAPRSSVALRSKQLICVVSSKLKYQNEKTGPRESECREEGEEEAAPQQKQLGNVKKGPPTGDPLRVSFNSSVGPVLTASSRQIDQPRG